MTKPWTERRDEAAVEKYPPVSIVYKINERELERILNLRSAFQAGADFGYGQGLADAKAESPPLAQIDESELEKALEAIVSDRWICGEYQGEHFKGQSEIEIARYALDVLRSGTERLTAESEITSSPESLERLNNTIVEQLQRAQLASDKIKDDRIAELEAERDSWKWEYENVCKFATQYETERDELKVEIAHFKTMEAEWDALETLHAERKALTAKLQKAKDWFQKIHDHEYADLMIGTYMKWREQAREALKDVEGE